MNGAEGPLVCHVCGEVGLAVLDGFETLRQVTSDCRPWRAGTRIAACECCGAVQKITDDDWCQDAEEIYRGYAIYSQAGGEDQRIFEPGSGVGTSRSERLVARLAQSCSLPSSGRLLDVGCGNGVFLAAFNRAMPGWRLAGSELGDKYRTAVEGLPQVEALYTCPIEEVPGKFDLVTMVHCLEHIPNPIQFARRLRAKLEPEGLLMVQVPDLEANPFDLLIADHCTHFSSGMLRYTLQRAGYSGVTISTDWVAKELSVVAARKEGKSGSMATASAAPPATNVLPALRWLQRLVEDAARLGPEAIGIFGSSIAGTWLAAQLGSRVTFFVDEDPNRIGGQHLGRLIIAPASVTEGATVVVPLVPPAAKAVAARLQNPGIRFVLPPKPVQP